MRRLPPRLRTGDRVVLVAPAGPPPLEQLDAGTAILAGWGLDVEPLLPGRHPRLPYLVDDDIARAKQLQQAWCDPGVAAVICVRGGYGCLRTLDLLDRAALAAAPPKLFTGSSDITVLHAELGPLCDVVTLFAPLIASEGFVRDAAQSLGERTIERDAATGERHQGRRRRVVVRDAGLAEGGPAGGEVVAHSRRAVTVARGYCSSFAVT